MAECKGDVRRRGSGGWKTGKHSRGATKTKSCVGAGTLCDARGATERLVDPLGGGPEEVAEVVVGLALGARAAAGEDVCCRGSFCHERVGVDAGRKLPHVGDSELGVRRADESDQDKRPVLFGQDVPAQTPCRTSRGRLPGSLLLGFGLRHVCDVVGDGEAVVARGGIWALRGLDE
eukprot:5562426-Pyramimonas_sp.AAC.1